MINRVSFYFSLCLAGMVTLMCGCTKESGESAAAPTSEMQAPEAAELAADSAVAPPEDRDQQLIAGVEEAFKAGDTNGAIAMLEAAWDDESFAASQSGIGGYLVNRLLEAGRMEEALSWCGKLVDKDARSAGGAVVQVRRALVASERYSVLYDWVQKQLAKDLPKEVAATLTGWSAEMLFLDGRIDEAGALVMKCMQEMEDEAANHVVRLVLETASQSGKDEEFEKLFAAVAAADKENKFAGALLQFRLHSYINKDNWDAAIAEIAGRMDTVDARDLSGALGQVVTMAIRKDRQDVVDSICELILEKQPPDSKAAQYAASRWIEAALKRKDFEGGLVRLQKLCSRPGADAGESVKLLRRSFYELLENLEAGKKTDVIRLAQAVAVKQVDATDKEAMQAMLLDGAFLMEDYAAARALMQEGYRADEEDWHNMALIKIDAHIALKEGRIEDAIAKFRTFMEITAKNDVPAVDPVTGIRHSTGMTLGFNAKRIGDLYQSLDKSAEAAAAYAEATEHFNKALAEVQPESREAKFIVDELKNVPGATAE